MKLLIHLIISLVQLTAGIFTICLRRTVMSSRKMSLEPPSKKRKAESEPEESEGEESEPEEDGEGDEQDEDILGAAGAAAFASLEDFVKAVEAKFGSSLKVPAKKSKDDQKSFEPPNKS